MNAPVQAPKGRRRIMLASVLLIALVVIGRAVQLQVLQVGKWEVRADRQHGDTLTVHAARGMIYDRNGVPLAGTDYTGVSGTLSFAAGETNDTLLGDPTFHAQNVYAIIMRILARFEHALGRRRHRAAGSRQRPGRPVRLPAVRAADHRCRRRSGDQHVAAERPRHR